MGTAETGTEDDDTASDDTAGQTPTTWYADNDRDGFGDPGHCIEAVDAPNGTVADGTDCDDTDDTVHPGAVESCNEVDDDCDGETDEGVTTTWYADSDGDGWGDPLEATEACTRPADRVADGSDCDDMDPYTFPGAAEVCGDDIDSDCSGIDLRCRLEGTVSLVDAELKFLGGTAGDMLGETFACGGDTDGDGQPEALIGEPQDLTWSYSDHTEPSIGGGWLVTDFGTGTIDLDSAAAASLWGDGIDEEATGAFQFLEDQDGDGYDELLMGSQVPAAHVFGGPVAGDLTLSDADATITHSYTSLFIGNSLAELDRGVFAVGGSGNYDFGTDGWGYHVGAVFVFDGPLSGETSTSSATATVLPDIRHESGGLGSRLCSGDLDGDGTGDLVASSPSGTLEFMQYGQVYVLYGPLSGTYEVADASGALAEADARISGSGAASTLGQFLSCGADADGDGLDDVLIGAPYGITEDGVGAAVLFWGDIAGDHEADEADLRISGGPDEYYVGWNGTLDADLDGDGISEIVVSDYADSDAAVHVFYGGASGSVDVSDADISFEAEAGSDSLRSVGGCPDLDGDGFGELLLGAPNESSHGDWSGAAYLVFGGGG